MSAATMPSRGRAHRSTVELVDRLCAGDRGALARAITAVENSAESAAEILDALPRHLGRAHVVGFTGAPGVGKSTLVSAFVREARAREQSVGVVAIDPSSPVTGGAVLGDRIRMAEHADDDGVFVRSLASRGDSGGLSPKAARVVDLMDAAGHDVVVVETVGAGQTEVDVAGLADTNVVVCAPGLGDEVQAIKAGILETADVLVVNKCDQPLAGRLAAQLHAMLELRAPDRADVPVLSVSAMRGDGIAKLAAAVLDGERPDGGSSPRREALSDTASRRAVRTRVAELAERDEFVQGLGVEVVEAGASQVSLRMTVARQHLNFNGSCHGGAIFSLADTAFGLASNSHGVVTAGIDAHISYPSAAREGDRLTAVAVEVARSNRLAVYRVDVNRDDGTVVAVFTGTVYITRREHIQSSTD